LIFFAANAVPGRSGCACAGSFSAPGWDPEHATRCLAALTEYGRPDPSRSTASPTSPDQGRLPDTVCIVERWRRWEDLDARLQTKVVPAVLRYNQLLKRPFDPAKDTLRITLSDA
jgi:hypothetical protein